MPSRWRLIVDGAVDGALNMALDRAAQIARNRDAAPPTLRLYRWARPTVSLGRFQMVDAVDGTAARDAGVDVVRRHTGGRGVLHADEVTYAVIASVDDGLPPGVAASYRFLCEALAEVYQLLGVDARLTSHDGIRQRTAACYLSTTRADLVAESRKLCGSAQVWTGSTALQHGSFVRSRDVGLEARLFRLSAGEAERLASETATLEGLLECVPCTHDIVAAAVEGFERALGVTLAPGGWTAGEAVLAAELLVTGAHSRRSHVSGST